MNHRGLQRALFRMRLDPGFAHDLLSGDATAERSTNLAEAELELLRAVDPAGLSADLRGEARAQALRNITSEYQLSTALLSEPTAAGFFASASFHEAVCTATSLPRAFGAYAREAAPNASARAVATLEDAMARARRETRPVEPVAPGRVALAACAHLVEVPAGTFARAAEIRRALDARCAPPRPAAARPPGSETILLVAQAEPPTFGLRQVEAECLTPLVARFLKAAAARPLSPPERRAFADREDADADDLEMLCGALLGEGALAGSLGSPA